MSTIEIDATPASEVTDTMLAEAAALFSSSYGVWGPQAAESIRNKHCQHGRRIKMSLERLRAQSLPPEAESLLVRGIVGGRLAGYAFATRWNDGEGCQTCWVTQLCVEAGYRNQGLATRILRRIRKGESDRYFGILSSHPAAIRAALRACSKGIEDVDLNTAKDHADAIMAASPVDYVRTAKPLVRTDNEPTVCCADTQFWVDHTEPLDALTKVKNRGFRWPFGDLPDGYEFLALIQC